MAGVFTMAGEAGTTSTSAAIGAVFVLCDNCEGGLITRCDSDTSQSTSTAACIASKKPESIACELSLGVEECRRSESWQS